uniref:Uncharacterized protein n=1 Tax=Nelumbo nucifera TaxID=4432 RepID=A0A822XVG6_NELNU|nr:TPA_asm: hypothetical protein HUJ06_025435 [Nelumbo nucifera]
MESTKENGQMMKKLLVFFHEQQLLVSSTSSEGDVRGFSCNLKQLKIVGLGTLTGLDSR